MANCHSNSAISRIVNLTPGDYELRYWYLARVRNTDPAWANLVACGSGAAIEPYRAWNDETNRIDVYIEKSGNYTFDAANIVDTCIYSRDWTERRMTFRVSKKSDYRISWKAAGREDTVGGLIDYIRLCSQVCP